MRLLRPWQHLEGPLCTTGRGDDGAWAGRPQGSPGRTGVQDLLTGPQANAVPSLGPPRPLPRTAIVQGKQV